MSFIALGGGSGKEGPKIDLVGVHGSFSKNSHETVVSCIRLQYIAIWYDIVAQMNVQQVVCNMVEKIL